MTNTTSNHTIETGLIVACFVGFTATNVLAILTPVLRVSPLILLISLVAGVGLFISAVYPIHQVRRDIGDKAQQVGRIQATMYIAPVIGGAMIALARSGGSDLTCNIEGAQVLCESDPLGGNDVTLAVSGLLFLAGGFWALPLDYLRHRIEDRQTAPSEIPKATGRHRASPTG